MTNYQKRKDKLRKLVNQFDLFDDMTKLAQALKVNQDLIKLEGFPLKEYKKWQKEQVKK